MTTRRLKLCISRLLQTCRSDDRSSRSSLASCGCGGSGPSHASLSRARPRPQVFRWKEETDFHVVVAAPASAHRRKVYSSSASNEGRSSPAPILERRKKRRPRTRMRTSASIRRRASTSSDDSGLFSSEDINYGRDYDNEDDTAEMLLISSSRSCSTDRSSTCIGVEHEYGPEKNKATGKLTTRSHGSKARGARRNYSDRSADHQPARLSAVFRRLAPRLVLEGPPAAKVRESYAVVKRSECPYEDFKGSMVEMIVEKEMFEEEDLQQLLLCFLSLNSSCHHGAIVAAFSVIWEALHGCRRSS